MIDGNGHLIDGLRLNVGETKDFQVSGDADVVLFRVQSLSFGRQKLNSTDALVEPPSRLPYSDLASQKKTPDGDIAAAGLLDVGKVLSSDVPGEMLEEHLLARSTGDGSTKIQSDARIQTAHQSVFLVVVKSSDIPDLEKQTLYLKGKRGRSQAFELAASPVLAASPSIPLDLVQTDEPADNQVLFAELPDGRTVKLTIVSNSGEATSKPFALSSTVASVFDATEQVRQSESEKDTQPSTSAESEISLSSASCAVVVGLLLAPAAVASMMYGNATKYDESARDVT